MKKIKAVILAGCILYSINIFAQTKICFGYDDASGNRTSRIISRWRGFALRWRKSVTCAA